MAYCPGAHKDINVKEIPITIDEEPTKDENTDPQTYTFPAGAIKKINNRPVSDWNRMIAKHLKATACIIGTCGVLLGVGVTCLIKRISNS